MAGLRVLGDRMQRDQLAIRALLVACRTGVRILLTQIEDRAARFDLL